MVENLKIGIIGTSNFTEEAHIAGFKNCSNAKITALCGKHNLSRLKKLAKKYDIPHIFTDYKKMLSFNALDAVVIASPNYLHYPMALKALDNKLHILCEKPISTTLEDAKKMYEKAEEQNINHMISFTFRFASPFKKAKELLEKNMIGDIFHFNAHFLTDFNKTPLVWRFQNKKAGFGALSDLAPHIIDLARWYVGEIKNVCSIKDTYVKKRKMKNDEKYGDVDVEDSAFFLAEFENNIQGIFQTSMVSSGRDSTLRIEISGSRGSLVIHRERGDIVLTKYETSKKPSVVDRCIEDRSVFFTSIANRFIDSITSNNKTFPSLLDGFKAQEIIEAVDRADKNKQWIKLPLNKK